MIKVLVIFGTRPEAIKMCPLVLQLKKRRNIETVVCLTGQHKEMLIQVMNAFEIVEDYNLSMITSAVLNGIEEVLDKEKPNVVLVHGDTTTSFAAGLVSFYHQVPIGHIEAGLRTYNLHSPYPEEFNRQAVDILSEFYFAPTKQAKENLLREGKDESKIAITGNTVIDALRYTVKDSYKNADLEWAKGSKLILLTAHRRENIGRPMESMFQAIRRIVEDNESVKIIYPIHKNPLVRVIAHRYLANHERIRLIEPLDVLDFHNFMKNSYLILTDSGGVQEEAPALGKPVLVMRETTERPEGVDAGTLKLVGTDGCRIYKETCELLNNKEMYETMSKASNPYGDGHASERIVDILIKHFGSITHEG